MRKAPSTKRRKPEPTHVQRGKPRGKKEAPAHGGWRDGGERTAGRGPRSPDAVEFHGMLTRDAAMKRVFHIVEKAGRREARVLVRGETGTGKELVARALHECSPRSDGPFKAVNCAALPATLLESELFGHVRGAFTGAVRDHDGLFRAAHGGTLFLDEIAEMPVELQSKLLRVLETGSVLPVGARDPVEVDVRIVAATHTSLRRAVEAGRFRPDLMYRLRVVPIFLPPLRQRPRDVPILVERFVAELNRQATGDVRVVTRIARAATSAMVRYAWPGNVRELRSALEYAYVVGEGPVLVPADLPPEIAAPAYERDPWVPAPLASDEDAVVSAAADPEVARIRRALDQTRGNRERAARALGMSRVTLWRRMREIGLGGSGSSRGS